MAADPQLSDYLNKLDKYYYCLPREGLEAFKCDVTVTLSGDLPPKLDLGEQDSSRLKFHLNYLGMNSLPVLSSAMGETGSIALDRKIQRLTNLSDMLIKVWGLTTVQPLFIPEYKQAEYRILKNDNNGFSIFCKLLDSSQTYIFDSQALLRKIRMDGPQGPFGLKLWFDPSPKGFICKKIAYTDAPGLKVTDLSLQIDYQTIQGFQLPEHFTFLGDNGDRGEMQIDFQLSNYQINGVVGGNEQPGSNDYEIIPSRAEAQGAKHYIWMVHSNATTVYLMGSYHVRRDTPLRIPEIVEQCFNASNYVGFEVDFTIADKIEKEITTYASQNWNYPEGDDLTKHLTVAQWKQLREILKYFGLPEENAIRLKPALLTTLLSVFAFKSEDYAQRQGIDMIFYRKALVARKPIFGMEYWQDQARAEEGLTDKEVISNLFLKLKEGQEKDELLNTIQRYWSTGDVASMEKLLEEQTPYDKKADEKLLIVRNHNWMKQLDRILMANGTYFIVVGAAHFVGPNGLLSLLRAKGYTVEQL
jgi:uncharacterized protein YbaP (TraB family)